MKMADEVKHLESDKKDLKDIRREKTVAYLEKRLDRLEKRLDKIHSKQFRPETSLYYEEKMEKKELRTRMKITETKSLLWLFSGKLLRK